jgi:2-keto-4-pentenoate hydratase/2-oxohepta-3-ene-1,7-dioic acid hydratase in catechol pathway
VGFSKSFDDTNPFGPVLVSAAAIPDPETVPLRAILNGSIVQNGNSSNQIFSVKKTIAFLSQSTTLLPGSVIMTGTPGMLSYI